MKKLIAAIVIASIGAAFADPYYVYDYKASIKRLEISAKYNSKSKSVTQKYNVKSDTIQGYVLLPVCENCEGTLESSLDNKGDGWAYLTLKSNSKLVKGQDYAVLKTPVQASFGVFGADQNMDHSIVDVKKATKAWMALDFPIDIDKFDDALLVVNKASATVPLGFFGLTNMGADQEGERIDIQNTGFGTAKIQLSSTFDFCLGGSSKSCLSIATISGTLVGYPDYLAACEATPIWDLCNVSEDGEVNSAVISGTWSLKFNNKLTNDYYDLGEDAILSKMGAKSYLQIDENGSAGQE